MRDYNEIEKSIIKKFKKSIWVKFTRSVREYNLINEGDRIAVCISGGKDSILMAKCFQELKRHKKCNFELEFIVMDPGYNKENIELIISNCKSLEIPIKIFESPIFGIVSEIDDSPCYLCARMRRGYLYSKAQELGCNKIALGHHFDDVIETILLAMLYGAEIKTMMPKLHSTNFENMQLIRPMYLVKEKDIIDWKNYNELYFINCACKLTEALSKNEITSKRAEMKMLVEQFRKTSPMIEMNIFRSVENINLDAIIGYKTKSNKIHFLDNYTD